MFRNVLVAVDGTPAADAALEQAADLAEALNARLTIVAVAPQVPPFAYRAPVDVQALETGAEAETQRILRDAVGYLPEALPVTTVLRHGDAGEEIVKQVSEGEHDLLVMGSRGRGRIVANVLGSVGAHVHYHSRIAMLVVQPE